MTKLSVNVNKIALLRNARNLDLPSVIRSVRIVLEAGAHGITVHPRPDERHIRKSDVFEIAEELKQHPGIEFNIEGNPFLPPFMEIVREVRPTQCTLVPDSPEAFTSDHGWNLTPDNIARLGPLIRELKELGCRVSLFMPPAPASIRRVPEIGADRIELYTEPYAAAHGSETEEEVFQQYARAAEAARAVALGINAGHDLNLLNLGKLCSIPGILEVSIGHALVADALEMGLAAAVRAYLKILLS